jgi:hypothetical protein
MATWEDYYVLVSQFLAAAVWGPDRLHLQREALSRLLQEQKPTWLLAQGKR